MLRHYLFKLVYRISQLFKFCGGTFIFEVCHAHAVLNRITAPRPAFWQSSARTLLRNSQIAQKWWCPLLLSLVKEMRRSTPYAFCRNLKQGWEASLTKNSGTTRHWILGLLLSIFCNFHLLEISRSFQGNFSVLVKFIKEHDFLNLYFPLVILLANEQWEWFEKYTFVIRCFWVVFEFYLCSDGGKDFRISTGEIQGRLPEQRRGELPHLLLHVRRAFSRTAEEIQDVRCR